MWFTSLNIDRDINSLWDDIRDGMILLQSQDKIQPGIVDWARRRAALLPCRRAAAPPRRPPRELTLSALWPLPPR